MPLATSNAGMLGTVKSESSHFANVICGPAVGVDMDLGFSLG